MGLAAMRKADDYVRVEYIENTSNAYIDTLIKGSNKISIQLKYIFKKNSKSTNSGFIFGSRVAFNDRQYGIFNSYSSQFRFGNDFSLTNYITDTDILVTLDNTEKHNELKILDSSNNLLHTLKTTNYSFSNNLNLYIFGCNNNGSLLAFKDTTKLYSCKIYDGTTLVRDFIPVYKKSTKQYGLLDRVNEKFYTSPNGVKFIGGHQIIYDAEIEYLESNGTQQINTLYVPKGYDNTIETKITYLGYSNTNSWLTWFSTYVDEETNTYRIIRNGNLDTQVLVYNGNKASGGGLSINVTVGTNYDLKLYPSYLLVNGTRYNFTTLRGNQNTNTLQLFGGKGTKIRMWGFKLTKGTTVILDMIPVRKDGVGYMYDKVSNKLFGNNGRGSFILGQDTVVYDKI